MTCKILNVPKHISLLGFSAMKSTVIASAVEVNQALRGVAMVICCFVDPIYSKALFCHRGFLTSYPVAL